MINTFRGEFEFLSNFYPAKIWHDGICYNTSEHFYQASKCIDKEEHLAIAETSTPGSAKQMGKVCNIREDWDKVKDLIMFKALLLKFTQHSDLEKSLRATNDWFLEEGNTWHDTYWGCCYCGTHLGAGDNKLGFALMHLRKICKHTIREHRILSIPEE